MTIRVAFLLATLVSAVACAQTEPAPAEAINRVLDDFHDAAVNGDKVRYLNHLTADAVFMGTDEQERWPKDPDFSRYVEAHFSDGHGWAYRSVERHVKVGDRADVAWFDEVVYSETNGRFRGTGVLLRDSNQWKIAHYALSFLVYNEDWDKVIELTKRTAAEKRGR